MSRAAPVTWQAGDAAIQRALSARLAAGPATGTPIHAHPRRSLRVIDLDPGTLPLGRCVLKTHHLATGRHRAREALKRLLGLSPAEREWRALAALHAAGVPVPRPLALGRLASGDVLLALECIAGEPLRDRFAAADPAGRERLVARLAAALARLHASGFCHGDLHLGNLIVRDAGEEIVLLDLQRARRARGPADRLRDLAALELSLLRAGWPADARARRRAGATASAGPGADAAFETALRRVAADRIRGRARRELRSGRQHAPIRAAGLHGRVERSIPEAELLALVAAAGRDPARRVRRGGAGWISEGTLAGRSVVVKGDAGASGLRRLVAAVRGSRAARGFAAGTREGLLLGLSARPLAWVEQRRLGLPGPSWLVLEHVGEVDLDAYCPASAPEALALARFVGEWLGDLHALGLHHVDLKGSNLRLRPAPQAERPLRLWLVDLEDLAGPGPLDDEARLAALAQLNASIPDAQLDATARREALARYCARMPFTRPALDLAGAAREIARRSIARSHRYHGEACGEDRAQERAGEGAGPTERISPS